MFLHSKQKYAYNTHKITHIEFYKSIAFLQKIIAHITATYRISEH